MFKARKVGGRLNRTSVGLKRDQCGASPGGNDGLNRTSVGLKQKREGEGIKLTPSPQSNQRGIETGICRVARGPVREGLNRTSVGLKPPALPQESERGCGLNRTSVGLKRHGSGGSPRRNREPQSNQRGIETDRQQRSREQGYEPQSNQRGIETQIDRLESTLNEFASIEPAWD